MGKWKYILDRKDSMSKVMESGSYGVFFEIENILVC